MNKDTVQKSIDAANEFIKRAKIVRAKSMSDKYCFFGCKATGRLRRYSLELSDSLVELRKHS